MLWSWRKKYSFSDFNDYVHSRWMLLKSILYLDCILSVLSVYCIGLMANKRHHIAPQAATAAAAALLCHRQSGRAAYKWQF